MVKDVRRVYSFSNENLTAYQHLYNFNDARVLSVGGSGDQYFTAILNGAKEVELYDKEAAMWPYFITKFYGIQNLSYEEFFELFVSIGADFETIEQKMQPYLPEKALETLSFWRKRAIIELGYRDSECRKRIIETHSIPYLEKESYEKLQESLRERKLPEFYGENLFFLPRRVGQTYYDIMLTSNIRDYVVIWPDPDKEYLKLLDKFNCPTIQAHYCFKYRRGLDSEFKQRCIETPVTGWFHDEGEIDYVYTYQKK